MKSTAPGYYYTNISMALFTNADMCRQQKIGTATLVNKATVQLGHIAEKYLLFFCHHTVESKVYKLHLCKMIISRGTVGNQFQ